MSLTLAMSRRDRIVLAVGATTIALLIGLSRGAPIYRNWTQDRETAALETARALGKARGALRGLPVLRDSLRARVARLTSLDSTLIAADSPSAIGASLAASIEALADSNALRVSGMQLRVDSVAIGGLVQAEVRVAGVTDIIGLAGFLKAVEGGTNTYVIRELAVAQSEPSAGPSSVETLRVDIAIGTIGAIRSGSASK